MSSYEPDDEDFTFFQEIGMQAFVKMEHKLLWQMRLESYTQSGAQAIKSLGAALTGDTFTARQADLVFVSLDFEGSLHQSKISELGVAQIASHQLLSQDSSGIAGFNFALAKHRNRKFMFGNTTRFSPHILGKTIVQHLYNLRREDPRREIILVSHGIMNDIRILDDIGVSLEALPVTGIIDTCSLADEIFGSSGSLKSLLTKLRIPTRPNLLHCAGNDAHYTLQALLALLQARYHDNFGQLERLARQESPLPECCFANKTKDDWADHLELDTCLALSLD